MTTPLFPAPVPLWAKIGLTLIPDAFAAGQALFDYFSTEATEADLTWCHVVARCTRATPVGTTEDAAQIGFDFANITGGELDSSWNAGDLDNVQDAMAVYLAALIPWMNTKHTWAELRFYMKRFGSTPSGFADMGDPVRVTPLTYTGSSSNPNAMPYQVAVSVTELTALRKHWGRFYLPGLTNISFDSFGRVTATAMTALADLTQTMYEDLAADELFACVPSAAHKTLLGVSGIQVDDIPDVQRRRRARDTLVRTVRPTP